MKENKLNKKMGFALLVSLMFIVLISFSTALDANKWSNDLKVSSSSGDVFNPFTLSDLSENAYVFWEDNSIGRHQIFMKSFNSEGNPLIGGVLIVDSSGNAENLAAVLDSYDRIALVWEDTRDGNKEIYFKMIFFNGSIAYPETRITNTSGLSLHPIIRYHNNNFHMLWVDNSSGSFKLFQKKIVMTDAPIIMTIHSPLNAHVYNTTNVSLDVTFSDTVTTWYGLDNVNSSQYVTSHITETLSNLTPGAHNLKVYYRNMNNSISYSSVSFTVVVPIIIIPPESNCSDGLDNDNDTFIDCLDPDCSGQESCQCVPTEEICDNIDNDCDGDVDEDLMKTITCGLGDCANTGFDVCLDGLWAPGMMCDPFMGMGMEMGCDGIDNDCNGVVDDTFDCFCNNGETQSCGVTNTGICSLGISTCSGNTWGACVDAVYPSEEVCDGLDNDCDGAIDDYLNRQTTCGVGACAGTLGVEFCTLGTWGGDNCDAFKYATLEICNGIDDNCDGSTDEGDVCVVVLNESICNDSIDNDNDTFIDCSDSDCSSDSACICVPVNETCNGLDDDCDGFIDENLTQATYCGLGACSNNTGFETCTLGNWTGNICDALAGAVNETCDGIDNDCDGDVDEDNVCGSLCSDTDNGIDVWTAGYAADLHTTSLDNCVDATSIEEYYCDGDLIMQNITNCVDFNAICSEAVDEFLPDNCACEGGLVFFEERNMCVPESEIPEFGVVAAAVAMIGALTIFIVRRRH